MNTDLYGWDSLRAFVQIEDEDAKLIVNQLLGTEKAKFTKVQLNNIVKSALDLELAKPLPVAEKDRRKRMMSDPFEYRCQKNITLLPRVIQLAYKYDKGNFSRFIENLIIEYDEATRLNETTEQP